MAEGLPPRQSQETHSQTFPRAVPAAPLAHPFHTAQVASTEQPRGPSPSIPGQPLSPTPTPAPTRQAQVCAPCPPSPPTPTPPPPQHAPSLTPTRGSDRELCDGAARVGPVRPRWLKASLLDRVSAKQPYTGRPTQRPKPASKQLHFTGTKLSRKQTRAPLCLSPHYSPEPRSGSHLKVH